MSKSANTDTWRVLLKMAKRLHGTSEVSKKFADEPAVIAGKKEELEERHGIWDKLGERSDTIMSEYITCRGCDNQAIVWSGLVSVMVMHEKVWTFGL